MTEVYLGLGSNQGDRQGNLEKALAGIRALAGAGSSLRVSSIYETPALLPELSPDEWNRPFLNIVVEASLDGTPEGALHALRKLERDLGRGAHERWAPRTIDIDILLWGDARVQGKDLAIPHPRMQERAFVLDPLRDLVPCLKLPDGRTSLAAARAHPQHAPLWMGVINVTPDSFSDGGSLSSPGALERRLAEWDAHFVGILDVGAESTRPGAEPVNPDEEKRRLEPALRAVNERYRGRALRPRISVDTRHAQTASWALSLGVDIINDVSGGADPEMVGVIRGSRAQYVLMHSLSAPVRAGETLPKDRDPVTELLRWFEEKTGWLERSGVARERIVIDPGIGFGKSALQSLEILRNLDRFAALPYRLMVGHSRKSFLNPFTQAPAAERDFESIGVSLNLAGKGADILRVHEPVGNIRAFRAWNHVNRSS